MPGGWLGSTRRFRLPPNWPELRALCFALYGDTCHVCGEPGANEVDHVIAGDDHSIENLRPIHGKGTEQRCHQRKSSAEGNAAKPSRYREPEPHPGRL